MRSASTKKSFGQEFREFITNGNILDLAVAIIIGIAFGAVVLALVNGILMPLIAAIAGEPNFDALVANVGDGRILYGTFITAFVNFLIIALVMFLVVRGVNRMQERRRVIDLDRDEVTPPTEEAKLLTEIRDLMARTTQTR